MPELPEVETIRRSLAPELIGRSITRVEVLHEHAIGGVSPAAFGRILRGRTFEGITRRGKYLVFGFRPMAGQDAICLVVHLRMTGRLVHLPDGGGPRQGPRWIGSPEMVPQHSHIVFWLEGAGSLVFHDVRKFGRVLLVPTDRVGAHLPRGQDPLVDGITGADLRRLLGHRPGRIKALLLRQDLVAGLGNIYVDESLHRAGLHPAAKARDIAPRGWEQLADGITGIIGQALEMRGTTLLDYRTGTGERGAFGALLQVYGREGQPCGDCGTAIVKVRVAGRGTWYCPSCQRADCV